MYLDGGNTRSFIAGATSWNDLSFNPKNGAILNGLTYSSLNGGVFVL